MGTYDESRHRCARSIFWLHHANIDRLWNVWLRQKQRLGDKADVFKNPADADWLDGPRDRDFAMPRLDGTTYKFTARDVLDTKVPMLDYIYDNDAAPSRRKTNSRCASKSSAASPSLAIELAGAVTMTPPKAAELIGSNSSLVRLNSDVVESRVRLDGTELQKFDHSTERKDIQCRCCPGTRSHLPQS